MERIHKAEMIRFAESPKGTMCWLRDSKCGWDLINKPGWVEDNIYIVDDAHAELRKLQIDKPKTKFKVKISTGWKNIDNKLWRIDWEYKVVDWTDDAIGKLCIFADHEDKLIVSDYDSEVDVLTAIHEKAEFKYAHRSSSWKFCRLLTKEDLK